jgi:hypothetical protein
LSEVTTGVPLYLVSACGSAEEFVAAFRRYAERAGLFVPIAEPLPQGRRGRIALTLKDGGVMVEGEAEIISSSPKPAGLHGRAGMTLKFVDLDEPSKLMLAELDKARLAMKPAPPTVAPRSAAVPAEPRPTVPAVGGRIDAANALAECVAIGDVGSLKEAAPPAGMPPGKFVIPTIPQVGGPAARPKTPSTPPALTARTKPPTNVPPPMPGKPTVMGMPPMERLPADDSKAHRAGTTTGVPPMRMPAEDSKAHRAPDVKPPTPVASIPPRTEGPAIGKPTTLGMPAVRLPADAPAAPAKDDLLQTINSKSPPPPTPTASSSGPTVKPPRHPTPYAPMPIVRLPASDADSERTDLTNTPLDEPPRSTSLGVATLTAAPIAALSAEDSGRAYVGPPPQPPSVPDAAPTTPMPVPPTSRSGGLRASEIMAAIAPSDDWTMTPDASAPTVVPADAKPEVPSEVKPDASAPVKAPPTGDWTISTDPASADGWTAPAKVDKPPEQPATGNRVISVASAQPLEAVEWEDKPTGIGEPLVQIDPTLMEPLKPVAVDDEPPINIVSPPPMDIAPPPLRPTPIPPPLHATGQHPPVPPPLGPPPMAGQQLAIPTPPPMPAPPGLFANVQYPPMGPPPIVGGMPARPDVTDGNTGFFRETGEVPRYPQHDQSVMFPHPNKRRTLIIVMGSAIGLTALLIVLVLVLGGKGGKPTKTGPGSAVAQHVAVTADATIELPLPGLTDAAVVEAPPIDAAPVAQTCAVDVTSVPTGADVTIESSAVGTTPVTLQLPCGVETKLTFKKGKLAAVTKAITPSADNHALQARFATPMFSVKVTSMPPGATITVRGKVLGITPTTVKLPAFASTSITLSKDGFQADTETIAPRTNNATHFVTLKKASRPQKLR